MTGLLQPPLDYPSIDDHASDVLGVDGVRRARRRAPPRTRVAQADGGTARTLTAEQRVTEDMLRPLIVIGPMLGDKVEAGASPYMLPSGNSFAVVADVSWENAQKQLTTWDDSRILVRYGPNDATKNVANIRHGRGPHALRPDFVAKSVAVEVELWNEPRKQWQWNRIFAQDVQAYCSVDMAGLTDEQQQLVATLFSEGGATLGVTRDELTRVAWAMRNRVDLIKSLEDAAAANPNDKTTKLRLDKVRGFGKHATYLDVLSHKGQFSGFGDPRYKRAMEPASKITNADECVRLQLCWDVALDVYMGLAPDPYAGQGNSTAPGVFYYMTKDKYDENVAWNQANQGKSDFKAKFAPEWKTADWPKLASQSNDHHWYWGMKVEDPFEP